MIVQKQKCTCGNELIFTDNSIPTESGKSGESRPIYYCKKCDICYDAEELDCENKYVVLDNKYKKWFV